MASRGHELYWRIYLLLNEGVPVVSKLIIARELKRNGSDIDYILDQNKDALKARSRLNELEMKVLFPADGGTDINDWTARIFISIILTLFRASLNQSERKQIRNFDSIQKEICANQEECIFDDETYDDHKVALKESLSFLASVFSDEVEKEIAELIDIYTNKPLRAKEIMQHIEGRNLCADTKKPLEVFLDSIPPDQNENDEYSKVGDEKNTADLCVLTDSSVHSAVREQENVAEGPITGNDDEWQSVDTIDGGNQVNVTGDRQLIETIDGGSQVYYGADNFSIEDNTAREEIENREQLAAIDNGSDDLVQVEAESGSDEIVAAAIEGLTEDDTNQILKQWQNFDLEKSLREKDFTSLTKSKLDCWQNVDVNIAVLGRTGVGKSRFINAFRGCKCKDDQHYAPVGSVETTTERKAYPHPRNCHLKLWDLPGIGTEKFQGEKFIADEKIAFNSYDIYLIMASDRFTKDETFFAEKIKDIGKVFLFVRTRMDINLEDVDDVALEVEKIREDCQKNLKFCNTKFKSEDVYLVSSKFVDHPFLDFSRLVERLVFSLPGLKKEALLYSLQFRTKELLEQKAASLTSRAVKSAGVSACGGAVPLPGLSMAVDYRLISKEIAFYRETLCITDSDLEDLARKTGKDVSELKRKYKLRTFDIFKVPTDITKLGPILTLIAKSEAMESTAKLLPAIGSVLAAGISCGTTFCFLKSNLKIMLEDAHKMIDILLKETEHKILPRN